MNIGLFTDTYYPQINGVATSTRILAKELNGLGHKVYIFTTTDPKAEEAVPYVFRLPSMPFVFLTTHRVTMLYPPKLLINMKKFKLDVIHTQTEFPIGIFGKVVSTFLKIPSVHTYHTMYEDYVHYVANGHLITPKMAQRYSRIFCNRADAVITPVQKSKDSLISYGVKRPISVIPTGLDFEPFSREKYTKEDIEKTKAEIGININDPIIVSVGRIAQEKSIDVLIKAMPEVLKNIPNVKFVIVGNGPKREDLENLSKSLGVSDSVIFTGPRPWDEIGKYYQLGDIFACASTSETQGLTYIEAIAAKVPVVAKKDRSIENIIIDEETGFYFESNEYAAKVICKALKAPDNNKALIDRAYSHIQHLSSKNFGKSVEQLYLDVINKNKDKDHYSSYINE